MDYILPLSAALLSLAICSNAQSTATATVSPAAQAASASPVSGPLDPSFAGFGIEPSNLYSFTGGSSANQLSINLLANLGDYSGVPPHLRIGGNLGDNMLYSSSYNEWQLGTNPNPVGQGNVPSDLYTFGPTYWQALDRFPTGTPITFGLNLAYDNADYLNRIVEEARAALNGLKNVNLVSFEIGNEPDLYLQNHFRNGSWDGQVYEQHWAERAAAVYWQVLQPAGIASNFFEGPATASTIGTSFTVKDLVQDNMETISNSSGSFLAAWNQHDYYYYVSVSACCLTLDTMLELSTTEAQFRYWTSEVSAALATGKPYYLREMASAGPIGLQGISDTFGAALWTLNFFCYTAGLGVGNVNMHMTDNSFASAWQPIEMYNQGPHVRPSYAAFAAMAQLIGSGNGSTQIAPITPGGVSSGYTNNFRAYAAYTHGQISAVVLINAQPANASNSQKGSLSITLQLPSAKGQTLYLSTLTADGADSTSGTTWNGLSFEKNDGKPTVTDDSVSTVKISDSGAATVTVRDSQAVIANIGYQLGSRAATFNGSRPDSASKKTGASSVSADPGSAAKTAAVATALTTTALALATGSVAGAGQAKETSSRSPSAASALRRRSSSLGTLVALVVLGLASLTALAR